MFKASPGRFHHKDFGLVTPIISLPDSSRRIAGARRAAESELKAAIAAVPDSETVEDYLPAFRALALSLLDAEAAEALEVTQNIETYKYFLEYDLSTRIIEGILPDQGLARVKATWSREAINLSLEREIGSEIISECRQDGTIEPARDEIQAAHAQHGDWEKFTPDGVRFRLRLGKSAAVREELRQVLKRASFYWLDRLSWRPARLTPQTDMDSFTTEPPFRVTGPDDAVLLICAGGDHYLWQIHNDGLGALRQVQLEVSAVQSFHSGKREFREASGFTFRWPIIRELSAGCLCKPEIFIRIEASQLGLWNSTGQNLLPWPNGDLSSARRWRLGVTVHGLSKPWTLNIEVGWIVGASKLTFESSDQQSRRAVITEKVTEPPTLRIVGAPAALGLEAPSGILPPPSRAGRHMKEQTSRILKEWDALGRPDVDAKTCDRIGKAIFPEELKNTQRGSVERKRVRERIRQAIRRSKRPAT